jgi:putative ABC transport system ATP-binding protein
MVAAALLTDVRKTYRTDHLEVAAVRGVSLEIEPAAFLSIAGPSGSGKTTLLNLLGALDTPTSGTIAVGDRTTAGLTARELADFRNAHLGFVFQTFNLIPVLTARENVELPLQLRGVADRAERRLRVEAILRDVGLAEMMDRRPNEMSGGQQQRVAIARALVKGPTLVLADEPTANLDTATAHEIMDLMREMNARAGTTFVFSTHDPLVMDHATRVVRLRDGLVESDERREPDRGH